MNEFRFPTPTPPSPAILPLRGGLTSDDVLAACGDAPVVYACDFHMQGAEHGVDEPGGLRLGRILNVDHHAPVRRMEARVTSTMLAAEFLAAGGHVEPEARVVINHTDCDSILSSALLLGILPADDQELIDGYVHSSLCADHTGELDAAADLLQALDEGRRGHRTRAQFFESVANLCRLYAGEPLEPDALRALAARLERRREAERLARTGRVSPVDVIAFGVLDEEIDAAFFVPLLPAARLIVLASPHPEVPGHWAVKIRLGLAAPKDLTLHSLGLGGLDPAFGGRWNAGSNKRNGGTAMAPATYARAVAQRVSERLAHPEGL